MRWDHVNQKMLKFNVQKIRFQNRHATIFFIMKDLAMSLYAENIITQINKLTTLLLLPKRNLKSCTRYYRLGQQQEKIKSCFLQR